MANSDITAIVEGHKGDHVTRLEWPENRQVYVSFFHRVVRHRCWNGVGMSFRISLLYPEIPL